MIKRSLTWRYYYLLGRHNGKDPLVCRAAADGFERYVEAQAARGVVVPLTYADAIVNPINFPSEV